ncbi:hypothetical protein ACFX2K_022473 [Malus domestica]
MPLLIYVSREKIPSQPHHFKRSEHSMFFYVCREL